MSDNIAGPIKQLRAKLSGMVLDGGFATQLEANGYDLNHELWSAKVLASDFDAIKRVHHDYLNAGSQCLITASYQATVAGLASVGLSADEAHEVIARSVTLAKEVIEEQESDAIVAASVGPYGAALADGSEYRGYSASVSEDDLILFHKQRWQTLWQAAPDLMACETIPSPIEVKAVASIANEFKSPFWLSVTCKDGAHLADGTPIELALKHVVDNPYLVAWGVNCTAPRFIEELITRLKQLDSTIPVIVYPNSGHVYDPATKTWSGEGDPESFAKNAELWRRAGASSIGGCCQTTPAHMAAVKAAIR